MHIEEDKIIIYDLMKQIIEERRILSKLYFEFKEQLNKLNNSKEETQTSKGVHFEKNTFNLQIEKEIQGANYSKKNRTAHYISFERISKNIVYILKQSPVPLSNKELISRLTNEFEIELNYSNLTSNILPRIHGDDSIPVYRAYRGYWQYKNQ
ncbi:hypothetical protein FQS96_07765 [Enterococcus faecalis]|uniref:hypothetical protein n=1 Tax=Enterococcus TaxID=1350 RepID=UPI001A9622A2|nr:hypothetical protein [Enterococcus faecalis]MBO1125367.1 hypothetical protein [Enterococcus faecalis]